MVGDPFGLRGSVIADFWNAIAVVFRSRFLFGLVLLYFISYMEPEDKALLRKTAAMAEENNKILRGIRRSNRWGLAWRIFYWVVIIAISYGAYVYVQPYFNQLLKTYNEVTGTAGKVSNVGSQLPDLQKILNGLPK